MADYQEVISEFRIDPLREPSGELLEYDPRLLTCSMKGPLDRTVTTTVEVEFDKSILVKFWPVRTGVHIAQILYKGGMLLPDPISIAVPPDGLTQQAVPSEEIVVGSSGINLTLTPITDGRGLTVTFGRDDVHCEVVGLGNEISRSTGMLQKNQDGTLYVEAKPQVPGKYKAQVFVFDMPLLNHDLKFQVIQDEGTELPAPPLEISNPLYGQQSVFPIQSFTTKSGVPIGDQYDSTDLLFQLTGPQVVSGSVIVMQTGLAVEFVAPIDGYYEGHLYDRRTDEEIADPLPIYVGTRVLRQQLANNGEAFTISTDGVTIALAALTNHDNQLLQYSDEDISIAIDGPDDEPEAYAQQAEDGSLLVTLNPKEHGCYTSQVLWNGKPILSKPLSFQVV